MFRSFYTLNREILLGYLDVDRHAENAYLTQSNHDPREHLEGGRSLANYFPGGYPESDRRPGWCGIGSGEHKQTDAFGDQVSLAD